MWNADSIPQQIPNMALTVKTIKVTRFRTLKTPYVQGEELVRESLCKLVSVVKWCRMK